MDTAVWVSLIALAGTVVAAFLAYRSSKSATAVNRSQTEHQWVQQAQQKAANAEATAEDAERRADACQERLRRLEVKLVTLESREALLTARIRYIVKMIHDPYQTLEQLQQRIPATFGASDD